MYVEVAKKHYCISLRSRAKNLGKHTYLKLNIDFFVRTLVFEKIILNFMIEALRSKVLGI